MKGLPGVMDAGQLSARAEVLTTAVRANMRKKRDLPIAQALQPVATLAWGVVDGLSTDLELYEATQAALDGLALRIGAFPEKMLLSRVLNEVCPYSTPDEHFAASMEVPDDEPGKRERGRRAEGHLMVLRLLFDTSSTNDEPRDQIAQSERITPENVKAIENLGVSAVIDLTFTEVSDEDREASSEALKERYMRLVHVPVSGPDDIAGACSVMLAEVQRASSMGQTVVVHCQMGFDRSACVATAVRAVRQCRPFVDELARVTAEFPDIAPSPSMARATAAWVEKMGEPDPRDRTGVVQCDHCGSDLEDGCCTGEQCAHTTCPFCGDGRGTHHDGCDHLVFGADGFDSSGAGYGITTVDPGLAVGPIPYLADKNADTTPIESLLKMWEGAPRDPWPNGLHSPPDRLALITVAVAMAGACVRCNASLDWDENGDTVLSGAVRVYALDSTRMGEAANVVIKELTDALATCGEVLTVSR